MNPKFLDLLCCPASGASLALESAELSSNGSVRSGTLVGGERPYAVRNGIPRFVGEEGYSASFGYEWQRWSRVQFEQENLGRPMAGHTTRMFDAVTEFPAESLRGKTIVDFGCGPGRFLDVVRRRGGVAVGLDMSLAVESARANFAEDLEVFVVQGDVLNPPFKRGAFDAGYSIGVLHHTPDPERGLRALVRCVRHGGRVACCVYPRGGFYDYPSVRRFRRAHSVSRAVVGNRLALGYSYLASLFLHPVLNAVHWIPRIGPSIRRKVERHLLVNLNLPDARWRVLDVFDAITPRHATTHSAEEGEGWAGLGDIRQTSWCETSWSGLHVA